jgi:hypothetical protein
MHPTASIALICWPLIAAGLFLVLPPRRAVVISFVVGFLVLPLTGFQIPGLPNYDKTAAVALSTLLGVVVFDFKSLASLRPHWLDGFVVVGVLGFAVSAIANGHGAHDGASAATRFLIWWGIPYILGRAYLGTPRALKEVAITLLVSMVALLPLIVYEFRMSGQLARVIYGLGGTGQLGFMVNRPKLFFPHGLAMSTYLGPLSALAVWVAASRCWKGWGWLSSTGVAIVICGITLLAFGRGSVVIMLAGGGLAVVWKYWPRPWLPQVFAVLAIVYILGSLLDFGGNARLLAVRGAELAFGEQKARSLNARIVHEGVLVDLGMASPIYGLGAWGANRLEREDARELTGHHKIVTDGLWIIVFSDRGLLGLIGVFGWMLVPGMLAVRWVARLNLPPPTAGVILGMSAYSFLYAIDCLMNAFWCPAQALIAGGLASFVAMAGRHARNGESRHATGRPLGGRRWLSQSRSAVPADAVAGVVSRDRAGFASDAAAISARQLS